MRLATAYRTILDLDYRTQAAQATYSGSFITPAYTFNQEQTGQLASRVLTNGTGIVQTVVNGSATNYGESNIYTISDGASAAYSEWITLANLKVPWFTSGASATDAGQGMWLRAMLEFSHTNIDTSGELIKFGWRGGVDTNFRLNGLCVFGNSSGTMKVGAQLSTQGNPTSSVLMFTAPGGTIDCLVADIGFPFNWRVGYGAMQGSKFPTGRGIKWIGGGGSYPPLTGSGALTMPVNFFSPLNVNEIASPILTFALKAAASSDYTVTRKRLVIQEALG